MLRLFTPFIALLLSLHAESYTHASFGYSFLETDVRYPHVTGQQHVTHYAFQATAMEIAPDYLIRYQATIQPSQNLIKGYEGGDRYTSEFSNLQFDASLAGRQYLFRNLFIAPMISMRTAYESFSFSMSTIQHDKSTFRITFPVDVYVGATLGQYTELLIGFNADGDVLGLHREEYNDGIITLYHTFKQGLALRAGYRRATERNSDDLKRHSEQFIFGVGFLF